MACVMTPTLPNSNVSMRLQSQLLALRIERGAIDFETVEAKPKLDERAW